MDQLRGQMKVGKRNQKIRGSVEIGTVASTATVFAIGMAITYINTGTAISTARQMLANGDDGSGTDYKDLVDMVRHTNSGDTAWADLDAAVYVSQHSDGANSAAMWSRLDASISAGPQPSDP
jgi:hypothetical protein